MVWTLQACTDHANAMMACTLQPCIHHAEGRLACVVLRGRARGHLYTCYGGVTHTNNPTNGNHKPRSVCHNVLTSTKETNHDHRPHAPASRPRCNPGMDQPHRDQTGRRLLARPLLPLGFTSCVAGRRIAGNLAHSRGSQNEIEQRN